MASVYHNGSAKLLVNVMYVYSSSPTYFSGATLIALDQNISKFHDGYDMFLQWLGPLMHNALDLGAEYNTYRTSGQAIVRRLVFIVVGFLGFHDKH